jgi:hypothetical protein
MTSTCDIAGCDDQAVAAILLSESKQANRCPDCLHWDGQNERWW